MRAILIIDIPDERLAAEGVAASDILAQFQQLEDELREESPDGTTITLKLE